MNNDELMHYRVLGMHWGVRRYQNKDGSLTSAGRKRATKLASEYEKLTGSKVKKTERFYNCCIQKYEYEDGIFTLVEIFNRNITE